MVAHRPSSIAPRVFCRGPIVLLTLSLLMPARAGAQEAAAVHNAQALRDSGDLAGAARILRAHLAEHPGDGDAARLLAQTLYWLKDVPGARREYEDALALHPGDTTLRVQYARMLVETGSPARAKRLLSPLPDPPGARAEAETLLGLAAYWEGDLTAARRDFAAALALNPQNAEARRHLDEIDAAAAPWFRASAAAWHDDQPLDRGGFEIEGGMYPSPLTSISVRLRPSRFDTGASTRTLQSADASLKTYVPAARIDLDVDVGLTSGSPDLQSSTTWTGGAGAAVRFPAGVKAGGRASRWRYLYTTASIDTLVMVDSVEAFVHLDRRGWLGEAAFGRQQYPDENSIRSAYAWLLAPVARSPRGTAQIGYAASTSDAAQSRFVLETPVQRYPPGDPRFNVTGVYSPYYTPDHVITHSVIGAVAAEGRRAAFHGSVSYAFSAHENAPVLTAIRGAVVRTTAPHAFTPWDARASLSIPAGRRATVEPSAETGRTAFYSWATASVQVVYRFRSAQPHP